MKSILALKKSPISCPLIFTPLTGLQKKCKQIFLKRIFYLSDKVGPKIWTYDT